MRLIEGQRENLCIIVGRIRRVDHGSNNSCVVANLQLAGAISREKELSVRNALGATPLRLVPTALYESLVLAVFGGLAGILLSQSSHTLLPAQ